MVITTKFGTYEACNEAELDAFFAWYAEQLTYWMARFYEARYTVS